MKELLIGENTEMVAEGRDYTCEYRMLIRENVGHFSCESYGVRVTIRETGEFEEIPDITVSTERIESLIDLLQRNTVTPCALSDVVADWL